MSLYTKVVNRFILSILFNKNTDHLHMYLKTEGSNIIKNSIIGTSWEFNTVCIHTQGSMLLNFFQKPIFMCDTTFWTQS